MTQRSSPPPVDDPVRYREWLIAHPAAVAGWLDQLLTPAEVVAEFPALTRSVKVLANMRAAGRGARYIKLPGTSTKNGRRPPSKVLYKRADLLRYLEGCIVGTSDDPVDNGAA